jgi:hypothetical protein
MSSDVEKASVQSDPDSTRTRRSGNADAGLDRALAELAPLVATDPRVPATLRIGVMGHRVIDAATAPLVEQSAASIFAAIFAAAREALSLPAAAEQFSPGLDLVVISPLAEGADRLLARAGLAQGCILGAILPFPAPEYEQTFDLGDRAAAKAEFRQLLDHAELPAGFGILTLDGDPSPSGRADAFTDCARCLNSWSDVVISIVERDRWNSQSGDGARNAVDLGIPTIVLDPHTPGNFTLWIDGDRVSPDDTGTGVARTGSQLLAPDDGMGVRTLLKRYADEKVRCMPTQNAPSGGANPYQVTVRAPPWARWCIGFNRWLMRFGGKRHEGKKEAADLHAGPHGAALIAGLLLRHSRADAIANAYAELHRSAQVAVAALGLLAVALAAVNVFDVTRLPRIAGVMTVLELVCVALAGAMIQISHRGQWLDRWLDSRLLAEVYRYTQFLLLAGRPTPYLAERVSPQNLDDNHSWTREHAQRVLRSQRLFVPGRGRVVEKNAVDAIKRFLVAKCIEDQIGYHRWTGESRRRFSRRLRTLGNLALGMTFLVVLAKLVLICVVGAMRLPPAGGLGERALNFLAIVAPAVAAALLALRAFGEHDVVAKRSTVVAEKLQIERERMKQARTLRALSDDMLRVARLLLSEVDGWFEVFADKRLE